MIRHTYNNDLTCDVPSAFANAVNRAKKYINLHEPFEESVFEHILKNYPIKNFIDIGCAWGYYSLLVKKNNPACTVHAFDHNKKMCDLCYSNQKLNKLPSFNVFCKDIPKDLPLSNLIKNFKQIDLLKLDIQGSETRCLKSAGSELIKIKNIIIGTHGKHHKKCHNLLTAMNFQILISEPSSRIPIQPDGLIWASPNE